MNPLEQNEDGEEGDVRNEPNLPLDYSQDVSMDWFPFIEANPSDTLNLVGQEFRRIDLGTGLIDQYAYDTLPDPGGIMMNDINLFDLSNSFEHLLSNPNGQSEVYTGVEQPLAVIHNGLAGTQINSHDEVHLKDGTPANSSPLPGTSTVNAQSPDTSLPREFRCSGCRRPHPRRNRAEACENSHSGAKPFACLGDCGVFQCAAVFSSKAAMMRHVRPEAKRRSRCDTCGKEVLRQNAARHRGICQKREGSSTRSTAKTRRI